MEFEELVRRFPDGRQARSHWQAWCPAHEDHRALLSLGGLTTAVFCSTATPLMTRTTKGRRLFHRHRGSPFPTKAPPCGDGLALVAAHQERENVLGIGWIA
jgi:hypothetical protein